MYEVIHFVLQVAGADPTSGGGSNNSDVLVAVVGAAGTVVVTAISVFVASFRREKAPASTVESIENQNAIRHEDAWKTANQSLREDLDMANYEKDNAQSLYNKLREAVRAQGLNPDKIMEDMA